MRQNYAYYMANKKPFLAQKGSLNEKYAINSSTEDSFEYFIMKGKSLLEFEAQAASLLDFLFLKHKIRIEAIALDFVKDMFGSVFFIDCNGFKVADYEKFSRLALMSYDQVDLMKKQAEDVRDKANNTVQCQLCRLCYKNSEVTKIVTYKMLHELKAHLNKRGIFQFDYVDKFTESTQSCKVCDICYMLVVAEHELIEVEKLYAISQNIPLEEKVKTTAESKKVSSDVFRNNLTQWRMLFYFQQLELPEL